MMRRRPVGPAVIGQRQLRERINDEATALRLAETLGGSFTREDADYLAWLEGIVGRLGDGLISVPALEILVQEWRARRAPFTSPKSAPVADVLIREPTPSELAERRPWWRRFAGR